MVFGCLVAVVSPVAKWPYATCNQSSAACFAFFCARFARRERLETHAGRGFQGGGLRPSLCCASLAQRRARGHINVAREHKSGGSPGELRAC